MTIKEAISILEKHSKGPIDPFLRQALNMAIAALEVYQAKPEIFKIVPNLGIPPDTIVFADPALGREVGRIINIATPKGSDTNVRTRNT